MPSRRPLGSSHGFSLVEMLVALVFTMVLMAGLASVFKSSLSNFYAAGEKLSSLRRNRMSTDLLYEDLNNAGMSLVDITSPLPSGDPYSAFYIIPNTKIDYDKDRLTDDPELTDKLYIAFDQPLAFEGKLKKGGGADSTGATAGDAVLKGAAMTAGTDNSYVIDCGDSTYAASVKAGMSFHLKDNLSHQALNILTAKVTGSSVTVTTATAPSLMTQVTGRGDPGALRNERRTVDAGAVFILPQQMVRYRIKMVQLDPEAADPKANKPNGIPCLVREQGKLDVTKAFEPDASLMQIITENVVGFKVYLSADSGKTWAGMAMHGVITGSEEEQIKEGWTDGVQAALNTQIAALKSQNFSNTSDPAWYRNIPVLVRLDVTTRTATKRTEFNASNDPQHPVATYKNFTQSLVIVPRHFGLPLK